MESLHARLFPGLSINIQRSNGLIHPANISTVNVEKSCVSVEWIEGGTTKGKEIDIDDVAAINPELLQLLPLRPKDSLPLQENVTVPKQKRKSVNSKIPALKEGLRSRSTRMSTVSEVRIPAQENEMEVELPVPTNSRKQFAIPSHPRASCSTVTELPLLMVSEEAEEQAHSTRSTSSANPGNSVRRKSCIVKEMEKMKNKREEKRAQNSELRIKRAQEYDSSFPNWEFARMIKEFRVTMECSPLTVTDPIEEHRICVCVRKRPLNKQELAKKEIDVISVPSKCLLLVHEPKLKVDLTKYLENQAFCFDFAFDETASNEVVYRFTARPLVQTIFEGGKATCFAYGQTGSGKTHTMGGDLSGKSQNASKGIYAMASRDVFLLKNQPRYRNLNLEVYVTFFEIYMPRRARGTRPEPGREPRHRAAAAAVTAARAMSFSEMNRRTLAFRGGGLVTGGGGPTNNNAGGEASSWPPQPQPRLPAPPAPQQPNGRGADEEMELEGLEPQDSEAAAGAAAAEDVKELLLLPQDTGGPSLLGGGAGGPLLAERNRRTLAFRGGGGGGLGNNGSSRGRPETSAWPLRHFNGRGPAAVDPELDALEGKEWMQDGASLSYSTEEEGASPGDGSGAEGGSCSSSRRSGGDGGDEAEGSGVGAGEGETVQHFPLARPKSLLQKLQCSFQTSWLKDFPWLRYSKDTGLMFCGWCQKIPEDGGGVDLTQVGHDELSRGTRNYKKTLLLRHHVSTEHKLHEANAQESEIPSEEGYCDFNSRPNENSYCYQLLRQLDEQRKKDILCDVSIVVSGKIFKAHKNILVAGSRFFKTLYCVSNKESPNQNNTTHLDIAAVQGFSVILDFLYSGNLVLTSQNAIEVMTVASYLQMSEVVQTCRNFIKDALNISIKSEAPESVVVDYNNRKPVSRDSLPSSSREQKIASFWATRNLTNLASNIKTENEGCDVDEGQVENYQMNDSNWIRDGSPELAENESQGKTKVFIWNNMTSQETGKARRKNQTTKRFVYNIPPNSETKVEDCSVMQPPAAYPEESKALLIKEEPDLDGALLSGPDGDRTMNTNLLAEACSGQDAGDAGASHDFKYGLMPGTSSDFKYGLLPSTSNDFKFGLLPGASNDFKYGLLPESWPTQETWENGDSSLIMNKLKCPHCSYVAKYRRTLKRHLLIHSGVRSFKCEICGKMFTRREHVKRHSLVHKKDKKYKCMVCKKIFMLAASVGIKHGSRRYGVCMDCVDKSQPGGQEVVNQGQDTEFPRDEEYEENEGGEPDEELAEDGQDENDAPRWDESGGVYVSG